MTRRTPVASVAGPIGAPALLSARTDPFSISFCPLQHQCRALHPACPGQTGAVPGAVAARSTRSPEHEWIWNDVPIVQRVLVPAWMATNLECRSEPLRQSELMRAFHC